MPNANYRKGARLERLARAQLVRRGYSVMRSAGSKGAWDLIAWYPECTGIDLLFIQVKSEGEVNAAAWRKFNAAIEKLPLESSPQMWERDGSAQSGWKVYEP